MTIVKCCLLLGMLLLNASKSAGAPMQPYHTDWWNTADNADWVSTPPHDTLHDSWSELNSQAPITLSSHPVQHHMSHTVSNELSLPMHLPHGRLGAGSATSLSLAPLPNDLSVQQNFGNYDHAQTVSSSHTESHDQGEEGFFLHPFRQQGALQQTSYAQLDAAGYYPGEDPVLRAQVPSSFTKVPLMSTLDKTDDPRFAHSTAVTALDPGLQDLISKQFFAGKLRWFSFPIKDKTLQAFLQTTHRRLRYFPPLLLSETGETLSHERTPELLMAKHVSRRDSMMDKESGNVLGPREYLSVWSTGKETFPGPYIESMFFGLAWIAPTDYESVESHLNALLPAILPSR